MALCVDFGVVSRCVYILSIYIFGIQRAGLGAFIVYLQ